MSPAALEVLQHYSWPGNVRELENALERAVILTAGEQIDVAVLPERITHVERSRWYRSGCAPTRRSIRSSGRTSCGSSRVSGGNKTRAADVLGIDPSTLYRKLSRFGVVA